MGVTGREAVVKGLESLQDVCKAKADMAVGEGRTMWASYAGVVYLALELLRERGSRVMTLEELDDLRGRGRAVWFDDRDRSTKCKDVFFVVVKDGIAYFKGETYSMQELEDGYGKTWRCWTSRPTDELREATPWDG